MMQNTSCCRHNGATLTWNANTMDMNCTDVCRLVPLCNFVTMYNSKCILCNRCTPMHEKKSTSFVVRKYELLPKIRSHTSYNALIISGSKKRYDRAALVAKNAGLQPSWLPGVFDQRGICNNSWMSPKTINLVLSHRNAWQLIKNTNKSTVVFEDDIIFTSNVEVLQNDIVECETSKNCQLLFIGFSDAHFTTHALYITPRAAHHLLKASDICIKQPADFYTQKFCAQKDWFQNDNEWHRLQGLKSHCRNPSAYINTYTAPYVFGMGHFLQNRSVHDKYSRSSKISVS